MYFILSMHSSGHDGQTLEKFAPQFAPPLRYVAVLWRQNFLACPPPHFCPKINDADFKTS